MVFRKCAKRERDRGKKRAPARLCALRALANEMCGPLINTLAIGSLDNARENTVCIEARNFSICYLSYARAAIILFLTRTRACVSHVGATSFQ